MWRECSDPARQAQPAKVLGPKLSFLQTLAQLSVQNPLLHFMENILVQAEAEAGEDEELEIGSKSVKSYCGLVKDIGRVVKVEFSFGVLMILKI